jgi:hypothetical protein
MSQLRDPAVAHHEVGHAVVADHLGADVSEIVLSERNQQEGLSHIQAKGLSEDGIRQILFAGSLAEIKYLAMAQWGCPATFDLSQLDGLKQVAYEEDYLEAGNPAIYFRTSNDQLVAFTPRDGNVFSDFEDFCSGHRETTSRDEFFRSLRTVMQLLDDTSVWTHVEMVAQELLEKGAVSTETFLEALRKRLSRSE